MKTLLVVLAVLVFCVSPALAVDNGNVSHNALAKMGLSGMNVMSDSQGTAVRGMGYASAWGSSLAVIGKDYSANGYCATSKTCDALAAGANLSAVSVSIFGCKTSVCAGGFSIAYAK